MLRILGIAGDWLLTAVLPGSTAYAAVCTPAERVCYCDRDSQGSSLQCYWEQLCDNVYRTWGYSSQPGPC